MTPDPDADEGDRAATAGQPDADEGDRVVEEGQSDGDDQSPARKPDGGVGRQTGRPEYVEAADEMDWRGWLLVGLVCVCFLVIPVLILFLPEAQGFIESLGLSLRQTYLALPMIPAILLGVTAVWAALRTQRNRKP
jgi:hypothetical protein